MKFEDKYPEAKDSSKIYENGNYIYAMQTDNCYICGQLTHFIEINVGCHICSEECDEKFYDEMFAAAIKS